MKVSFEGKIAIIGLLVLGGWLYVILPLYYLWWLSETQKPSETVLLIGNLGWTAIGAGANVVYVVLTAGILIYAGVQVRAVKREAQISRTLAVCDKFDTDPILDKVTRRLSKALRNDGFETTPQKYRIDLSSLFNYFESIAIGLEKGLYDEAIVRDYMEPIIVTYVADYVDSGIAAKCGLSFGEKPEESFNTLNALIKRWKLEEDPQA